MITEEFLETLKKYRLHIVKREKGYSLIEIENNEWYQEMSLAYIESLISKWENIHKKI